jgi:hypothetical protein
LESNQYNKANEVQEELCNKKLDWRLAQLHLAAAKAQVVVESNQFRLSSFVFRLFFIIINLIYNYLLLLMDEWMN